VLFVPLVAWGSDALAADAKPAQGAEAKGPPADAKPAHGEKEPDIFDWALDLTIWTVVVFLVLLGVLTKYAWGPMLTGLQKREQNIHAAVAEAQAARDEAEKLRVLLKKDMDQAADRVRQIMDDARRDAQHTTDEMIAKARGEIQAERERLRREIEMAKDQALHELWAQTAQLAALVSSKAIRRSLTAEDHRRLVDEALAELQNAPRKSVTKL
jgi:F-type H+-transporting ATPase subunit b